MKEESGKRLRAQREQLKAEHEAEVSHIRAALSKAGAQGVADSQVPHSFLVESFLQGCEAAREIATPKPEL